MFDSEISKLMTDIVHHSKLVNSNAYGVGVFGEEWSYRARVTYKNRAIYRPNVGNSGIEVSSHQVWIAGDPALELSDRIRLPDGSTPQILTFERSVDERGNVFTKVYL